MVMIITHIAYNTCAATNDAWHAYGVIGVYKIHHGAGRLHISRSWQYYGWLTRSWAKSGPVTVDMPHGQNCKTIGQKKILF